METLDEPQQEAKWSFVKSKTLYDEGITDDRKLQDMLTSIQDIRVGYAPAWEGNKKFKFSVLPLPDLECKWKKGQWILTQGAATANQQKGYKQHGCDS